MKKSRVLFILLLVTSSHGLPYLFSKKRIVVDTIVARVNGTNILKSDLELPRMGKEGGFYTLDEAILEELIFQRAVEMHMLPTPLDIDRQIVTIKIQNNLTDLSDRDFEDQLKESGYTMKMYKNQIGRLIAIEKVKQAEISEKIVVTTQDVEEYYHKHPEYTKEEFHLASTTLSPAQKNDADALLKSSSITWNDLGWIAKKDLGHKFMFVTDLDVGEIREQAEEKSETGSMFEYVKLVDKHEHRLKTLDERYSDIERHLQQERKEKFMIQFEKELRDKASIVIL
jgi:parvulin-like peptidyl-prolyl isomerase